MKNRFWLSLFLAAGLALCSARAQAQTRVAYVDSKAILERVPEYAAAQRELEEQSKRWQKELDDQYVAIEQLYDKYRAEEVLLSEATRRQRQDEILAREKEAKELQRKRFGVQGDLFKQQEERIKPIQDRVFQAIEALGKERRIDMIIDRSGAVVVLYANPNMDVSDGVLAKLGISGSVNRPAPGQTAPAQPPRQN